MPWFDIGVNLADKRLSRHLNLLQDQCMAQGVSHLIAIGCDLHSSKEIIEITADNALAPLNVFCTAGFHPHNANQANATSRHQLAALVASEAVVAVGECGLDYNRNFSSPADQLHAFEWQLELACEVKKPVYLHERDAFTAQVQLLEKYIDRLKGGVIHCFTGTVEQLRTYLDLGLYIGITGWICDLKRGDDLRNAITDLPLNRLMLETDSPYLTPKNLTPRPKNNHPGTLPIIGEYVAKLKHVSIDELQHHSFTNAMTLFELGDAA